MAEVCDHSYCPSGLAFKSKLLRSPKAQFGFVPKLSHHSGKNTASLKNIVLWIFGFKFKLFNAYPVFQCSAAERGFSCNKVNVS